MSEQTEVLLASDDAPNSTGLRDNLVQLGYAVRYAANSELARLQAESKRPEVLIIQLDMVGAVDTARQLQKKYGSSIILIVDVMKGVRDAPITELRPVGLISQPLKGWELSAMVPAAAALTRERAASRDRERMLGGIVDGMLDSVVILDRQGNVSFANSTSSRLLKRPLADIRSSKFDAIFQPNGDGNNEIKATIDSIFADSGNAIGSGGRGTVTDGEGGHHSVVVIANPVRDEAGKVSSISLSFRAAPPVQKQTSIQESAPRYQAMPKQQEMILDLGGRGETGHGKPDPAVDKPSGEGDPLREQAIRALSMRVESGKPNYGVVLVLSQFDMFRMRYGVASAERLLHALSAQVMKTLPPEDRLYQWSNRALIALCERDSSLDEVRLEMTALCSRRIDYFLNGPERSALVTLSAAWTLLPLYRNTSLEKVIEQIDGFVRQHSRLGG
jgi:PAS domain-containing protein